MRSTSLKVLGLGGALWRIAPEAVVAAAALLLALIGVGAGLPLVLPDAAGLAFVERHYFRPVLLALVVQAVALGLRGQLRRGPERRREILAPMGLVLITGFVHFNLKAWMPLVHARLFDAELMETDRLFGNLVPAIVTLRRAVGDGLARAGLDVDPLYHNAFVAMFFAAFMAHAVLDSSRGFRRVVLGASLVLLLGGLLYWILPAKGPFVYRVSESRQAAEAQRLMEAGFDAFVKTRIPPPGYFTAPLAAMPSLHVAHATLFTVLAWRRLRWLGMIFGIILAWVTLEAVASGWHYVLDLPVGSALALGSIWLSDRLLPDPPSLAELAAPVPAE